MSDQIICRFAPSPTGSLHLGGLRTALFSYAYAKHHNGKFFLRIEDTDRNRFVLNSDNEIIDVLTMFNLHWDNSRILYQSENIYAYIFAAENLVKSGLAYKCYCAIDNQETCECSELNHSQSNNAPYCIKLRIPKRGEIICNDELRGHISFDFSTLKDIVILKQDRFPTYHLASVLDDISMGVTHVFRGEEWISSLPYHLYLYGALLHPRPPLPKFYHLPLILDPVNNCKLSKRNNNASVMYYLEELGIQKEALLNYISTLGYSSDCEFFTLDRFISDFSTNKISTHNACFDIDKLMFYNKTYLSLLSNEQILNLFSESQSHAIKIQCEDYLHAISIFRGEANTILELFDKILNLISPDLKYDYSVDELIVINNFKEYLKSKSRVPTKDEIDQYVIDNNLKNKEFHPVIRYALTGKRTGYQIYDIIRILGIDKSITRVSYISNMHIKKI